MTIQRFICNFIEENCYIVSDDHGQAAIIDCGAYFPEEKQAIARYVSDNDLTIVENLYTHGHFDHVFGADFVHTTYGLLPRLSADEQATYAAAAEQMRMFLHRDFPLLLPTPGAPFAEGDVIAVGTLRLRVIATPGHTPGGVCFYEESEGVLLSGDSLFDGEIGRCDLPGGDEDTLVSVLQRKVLTLPEDVTVLPGHGDATTVGREKRYNRHLR